MGLLHVGYIMNKQGENPQMELIQLKRDFRNRHPWVLTTSSSCLQARTEIWGDCFNFYRTLKGTWKSGCNWLNLIYILRGLVSSGVCIATSLLFRNNSPTTCILWVILKCFPVYYPLFSVLSFYHMIIAFWGKAAQTKIFTLFMYLLKVYFEINWLAVVKNSTDITCTLYPVSSYGGTLQNYSTILQPEFWLS